MPLLPPPPVPARLREMLKDYPEHIARLQEVLEKFRTPSTRLMPFDEAIWALEGRLETFIAEARRELEQAEITGDTEAVESANARLTLMFRARSANGGMSDLDALWDWIQAHRRAFE